MRGASDGENVYRIDGINTGVNVGCVGKTFSRTFQSRNQVKLSRAASSGIRRRPRRRRQRGFPKRGLAAWHGRTQDVLSDFCLDANAPCASGFTSCHRGSLVCCLRLDPYGRLRPPLTTGLARRHSSYYIPKMTTAKSWIPDTRLAVRFFRTAALLFSSTSRRLMSHRRYKTFTGKNTGPRGCPARSPPHNISTVAGLSCVWRLVAGLVWRLELTPISRTPGSLGTAAPLSRRIPGFTIPSTFPFDNALLTRLSVYSFGGDWTPNL